MFIKVMKRGSYDSVSEIREVKQVFVTCDNLIIVSGDCNVREILRDNRDLCYKIEGDNHD